MSRTRNKLDEARFFLAQFDRTIKKRPERDYFLGAYVSSARSVIWVMNAEYLDVLGWSEWYDSVSPTSEEDALFKEMNEARLSCVKRGSLRGLTTLTFEIPREFMTEELGKFLDLAKGKSLTLAIPIDSSEGYCAIVKGETVLTILTNPQTAISIEEFEGKEVLGVCNRYFLYLENLVNECAKKFDP